MVDMERAMHSAGQRVIGERVGAGQTGVREQAEFSPEGQQSILIASNRPWTREALLPALLADPSLAVVGQVLCDLGKLDVAMQELRPRIVVVDQQLLAGDIRLELRRLSVRTFPAKLLLLMTAIGDEWANHILGTNVSGVLLEGSRPQNCVSALSKVGKGEIWLPRWLLCRALVLLRSRRATDRPATGTDLTPRAFLTPREREIALLVAHGLSNKEVAARGNISIDTVKKHLTRIYNKFRVHHRSALAARLLEEHQER